MADDEWFDGIGWCGMSNGKSASRVLVTGLSTYWGGRLAEAIESSPDVEAVIGVDSREPTRELDRTEFVRVGAEHSLIEKIVRAAAIDTVIDTRLMVDSTAGPPGSPSGDIHEHNVIGTLNILAACSASDSTVRKFIFKSSGLFYGAARDDPAFFTEEMTRGHRPRTQIEKDVAEVEAAVADFRTRRPEIAVSVLRFANVLGSEVDTAMIRLLQLPLVPMIAGFDPRLQFVDEIDVVHALEHVAFNDLPGTYNVAADGVLALSEVASLLGKRPIPVIPPWGTGLATSGLRRLGVTVPPEMLDLFRYGRGMDNRVFKSTGFHFRHTSRESVLRLRERFRMLPVAAGVKNPYRYEPEVEEFLRRSPNVIDRDTTRRHFPEPPNDSDSSPAPG